jgi:hypothetical protein
MVSEHMDIKLSDLFTPCPRCGGTGRIDETSGNYRQYGGSPDCHGRLGTLTEAGKELAKFIELINQRGSR